jgi:hypothetical protein
VAKAPGTMEDRDLKPLATARWIGCRLALREQKPVLVVEKDDYDSSSTEEGAFIEVWPLSDNEGAIGAGKGERLFFYRDKALSDVRYLGDHTELLLDRRRSASMQVNWFLWFGKEDTAAETEINWGSHFYTHSRFFMGVGAVGEVRDADMWLVRFREEGAETKPDKPVSLGPGRSPVGLALGLKKYLLAINVKSSDLGQDFVLDAAQTVGTGRKDPWTDPQVLSQADKILQEQAKEGVFWDRAGITYDYHLVLDRRPLGPLVWGVFEGGKPKWIEVPGAKEVLEFAAIATKDGRAAVAWFEPEKGKGFLLRRVLSKKEMGAWEEPVAVYRTPNIPVMVDMIEVEGRTLYAVVEQECRVNPKMFLKVFSLPSEVTKDAATTVPATTPLPKKTAP